MTRIDLGFNRVNNIQIEKVPNDILNEIELKRIYQFKPPLNYQTSDFDEVDIRIAQINKAAEYWTDLTRKKEADIMKDFI